MNVVVPLGVSYSHSNKLDAFVSGLKRKLYDLSKKMEKIIIPQESKPIQNQVSERKTCWNIDEVGSANFNSFSNLSRNWNVKKDCYHKNLDSVTLQGTDALEGEEFLLTFHAFIQDLKSFRQIDSDQSRSLIEMVQNAYDIAVERDAIENLSESSKAEAMKNYSTSIKQKIQALQSGEKLLFEGLFSAGPGEDSCHAILYEIICITVEGKRKLAFKIINSGLGVDKHPSALKNDKEAYQSYLITEIEPSVLEEGSFIDDLVSKECGIASDSGVSDKKTVEKRIDEFYELCKKVLMSRGGGVFLMEEAPERFIHHPQVHGICSRKIWHYWLQESSFLTTKEYRAFKCHLADRGLRQLWVVKTRERKHGNPTQLHLTHVMMRATSAVRVKRWEKYKNCV